MNGKWSITSRSARALCLAALFAAACTPEEPSTNNKQNNPMGCPVGVLCMPDAATCDGQTAVTFAASREEETCTCVQAETRTDCAASGQTCMMGACVAVNPGQEICDNTTDDDADGLIDCADPDCAADPACQAVDRCMGVTCNTPPAATCDGTRVVTFAAAGTCDPADGMCDYAEAMRTDCAANAQACMMGACVAPAVELCDDMMDNDGDNKTDCADEDCAADPVCAPQPTGCLLISQYMEGTSNNKALELYNCGAAGAPDLNLAGYLLCQTNRNATGAQGNTLSTPLAGTLAVGAVTVYCNANEAVLPMGVCDGANRISGSVLGFNGNDTVYVVRDVNSDGACDAGDTVLDAFGHISGDASMSPSWADRTYDRCDLTPFDGSGAGFDPSSPVRYIGAPADTVAGFGQAPSQSGCPMPAPEVCDDMIDNDLDGQTDCADMDCAADAACLPPDPCMGVTCDMPPAAVCDGASAVTYVMVGACNNGMCSYAEAMRTDCAAMMMLCSAGACVAPPAEICNDNIDNDLDGQIDCMDADCVGTPACAVDLCVGVTCDMPPMNTCDGDVAVTHMATGMCNSATGMCLYPEVRIDCATTMQICDAGLCVAPPAEVCTGGLDEDRDGLIDCADPDCAADAACQAAAPCLIISQLMEGTSNNKALEIFNCSAAGSAALDLDDYLLCQTNRTGATGGTAGTTNNFPITGMLAAGAVRVYCNNQIDAALNTICNETSSNAVLGFNGNDTVYIVRDVNNNNTCDAGDTVMDSFGNIAGAGPAAPAWVDKTYSRCDLTPFDGSGTSFDPLMPVRYTAVTNSTAAGNSIVGFGVAPVAGCP